jgi:hypothetical protein
MAQRPTPTGSLPCLFCGAAFGNSLLLTMHLDMTHERWVDIVMQRLGLPSPGEYPIDEYRRALAEAFIVQERPAVPN